MVGVANGFFIVLHHHQRVALVTERLQGTEQNLVVARMQANGGLVEYVTHPLQVAPQLRCQPYALRFAAAQGGCAAVQRQVAQSHLFQKLESTLDFGNQVPRNVIFALAQAPGCLQRLHPQANIRHAHPRERGNSNAVHSSHRRLRCATLRGKLHTKPHRPCRRVQTCALTCRAGGVHQIFHVGLRKGLLAALVVIVFHRIVKHLALLFGQCQPGTDALRAPAVLAVVAEQARIEFGVRSRTHRAGTLGGEHLHFADTHSGCTRCHCSPQTSQIAQNMDHTFAVRQGQRQRGAQGRFIGGTHIQTYHRQLDVVFLETVDAWKPRGRQKVAIHAQMREAARPRPVGQFGVHALTPGYQRRQQPDVLPTEVLQQLRRNTLRTLRRHRRSVLGAMLHPQLDIQQAQEMPDLGGGAHRRLAPATREALLDGHRGWYAIDRVHFRAPRWLDDGAGVGVKALEVAALSFVEKNVKGQGGLAGAGYAGDHTELAARDVDA